MIVTFHGVRGSIPAPGSDTVKYGGNTACVYIKFNNGSDLILDSGTGIRRLGKILIHQDNPLCLLLSHRHWDHIQGFPFFLPVYQKDRRIQIYSGVEAKRALLSIRRQMDGATFPVHSEQLPCCVQTVGLQEIHRELESNGVALATQVLNHPGGGRAFRFAEDGVSVAYVTDNELEPPGPLVTPYDQWVAFCRGVDLLIHDAQYTEEDMPHKHGWGHSLISQVRQLALDAEVRNLVMFHHDPDRSDIELEEIERENETFFKRKRVPTKSFVSFEGLTLKITAGTNPIGKHSLEVL